MLTTIAHINRQNRLSRKCSGTSQKFMNARVRSAISNQNGYAKESEKQRQRKMSESGNRQRPEGRST
eukprot:1860568-Amphidinium_carterae.1